MRSSTWLSVVSKGGCSEWSMSSSTWLSVVSKGGCSEWSMSSSVSAVLEGGVSLLTEACSAVCAGISFLARPSLPWWPSLMRATKSQRM